MLRPRVFWVFASESKPSGEAFGATLTNLTDVHHGVCSDIRVKVPDPLFTGLEPGFRAGRYHSWVVSKENFPDCLEITAEDVEEGQIMALRHREYDVRGIQFHPESVLTPKGKTIIWNWIADGNGQLIINNQELIN